MTIGTYRTTPTDDAFWLAWRDDPGAMRAAGYSVQKSKVGWIVRIRKN